MQRTKNAVRNLVFGFINKMIIMLFPFVIRTIIIRELGAGYLGLGSLFTSILQVLNLAELGFSSAVVFCMYKPIAEKDSETICALLNLYKQIYRIIGIVILVIGLALTPFLPYLIKGTVPNGINIYILYYIYLFNTAITYFLFAYKSTLLVAHQRNDVVSNISSLTNILQYFLQIVVLIVYKNYYLYVILTIITTILNNIMCAWRAKKMFPNYIPHGKVNNNIKKEINEKVMGLMIQRVCATTRNSLDSIFISAFIGLNAVAIYTNYYTIMNSVVGITAIITSAITAGIGHSIVTESEDKNYRDMNKFNFMYMWISGWCTVCLACLYQPFMELWMGKEYMLSYGMVILLCIYFYSLKIGVIRGAYSDAKGLWWENRYRAIVESVANILLNFLFVKLWGIYGVVIGTNISLLVINFGYGSQILFQHYFVNQKIREYFTSHFIYALVTLIVCWITYSICSLVNLQLFLSLIIKLLICIIVPNILYFLFYFRTKRYHECLIFVKKVFLR